MANVQRSIRIKTFYLSCGKRFSTVSSLSSSSSSPWPVLRVKEPFRFRLKRLERKSSPKKASFPKGYADPDNSSRSSWITKGVLFRDPSRKNDSLLPFSIPVGFFPPPSSATSGISGLGKSGKLCPGKRFCRNDFNSTAALGMVRNFGDTWMAVVSGMYINHGKGSSFGFNPL